MTSIYSRASAQAFHSVQAVFGEPANIHPMSRGNDVNGPLMPDPSRAAFEVAAVVFKLRTEVADTDGHRGPAPRHIGARITAKFALADLPYEPTRGDLVERPTTGEVFAILYASDRRSGRITFDLAIAARDGS